MVHDLSPFAPQALERTVPRYTSYPTAPHFTDAVTADTYWRWLARQPAAAPLSLYLHIPFCARLCWFCACRTQGARDYAPVDRYLGHLEAEIAMIGARLGPDHPVSQMHWGGGSPTIMRAEDMHRLYRAVERVFPGIRSAEMAVEIDPRDITEARMDALAQIGITRGSIGVQDFEPCVQSAIGREQGFPLTRSVVEGLRARGVAGINIDLLYGLPCQTEASLRRTVEAVISLKPDRVALFGYAHVPWMSRRQKLIDVESLPGVSARQAQAVMAGALLAGAGYQPVGIDHFALPGDAMAAGAQDGTLKRNFQGYTVDPAETLIGMGASSIGMLPEGYVQNIGRTAEWQKAVSAGQVPVARGHALTLDDRPRQAAIQQILCSFALDAGALVDRFGDFARPVIAQMHALMAAAPEGALLPRPGGFEIAPAWQMHTRLIAAEFDSFLAARPARHSLAV
ncbi:MAG: oxygen-independent coproporphyrinogen III oxidase [Pseudomonadota bacterium]